VADPTSARTAQPRSLIVTIYGAYAREAGGWLSVAALIRMLDSLGVDEGIGRALAHSLERPDRLAKLDTRAAIRHGHLENRLAGTDLIGAQDRNGLQRRRFQALPAAPLDSPENRVGWHLNVVETDLIHLTHPAR